MQKITIESVDHVNLDQYLDDIKLLCSAAEQDRHPMAKNYRLTGWEDNPASLLYILTKTDRYHKGRLELLYRDGVPIAISGCYVSDWSNKVLILGSRTYTVPGHRNEWWHSKYLLPRQLEVAEQLNCDVMLLSFEKDSDRLYKFIERITLNKTAVLGHKNSDFYKSFQIVPGTFLIKGTPQKIAVALLNSISIDDFYSRYKPPEL